MISSPFLHSYDFVSVEELEGDEREEEDSYKNIVKPKR